MEKVPFLDYREVLVTGGTGFLGRHVCRALIARGHLPRLLVRVGSEDRIPEDIRRASRVTPGDVTNREFVENAAQSTNAIVHLAGIVREYPEKGVTFGEVHVEATRHAVHAAQAWGIPRFVYVSALGAAAGDSGDSRRYFASKGEAEAIVRRSGLSWTVFRPGGIFGPGDRFISELEKAVRRAPFLPVPGDGTFLLQPVFVGDVVKGIVDCLARPDTSGRTFDVSGPDRIAYGELVDRIAAAAGIRVRKVHVAVPTIRKAVRVLSRFGRFPLTNDMLDILLAGYDYDGAPYYTEFGIRPISLSEYLASRHEADSPSGTVPAEEGPADRPGRREEGRSMKAA